MAIHRQLMLIFLVVLATSQSVRAQVNEQTVDAFVKRFARDHEVSAASVREQLSQATYRPGVIETMDRPAEGMPWYRYRKIFMTDDRIAAGVRFWEAHRKTIEQVSTDTGVAPEVILGILGVESFFGERKGKHKILDVLYTLAFAYPRRTIFFQRELEEFLVLTKEEQLDLAVVKGSYAGAMGYAQFMPSSYRAYAKSFEEGGTRDLINSPEDAIASVANYLAVHRWKEGAQVASAAIKAPEAGDRESSSAKPKHPLSYYENLGFVAAEPLPKETLVSFLQYELEDGDYEYWYGLHNFYVITRYNRSRMYAMVVFQLGEAIKLQMAQ
ncbi:MAG: lytic murein transglycosylase B [Bacteroidota bacterium]